MVSSRKLVFLVGSPRSGTTWLQLLLSQSDRVATANETHLFSGYLRTMFSSWDTFERNGRGIGLSKLIPEEQFFGWCQDFCEQAFDKIVEADPKAEVILEKTPDHLREWQSILRIFPDAYFLHLVRDPRGVVASMKAAGNSWGASWAPTNITDNSTIWKRNIDIGCEIGRAARNFFEVRYEDLLEDGTRLLRDIFDWLDIPVSQQEGEEIVERCRISNLKNASLEAAWDLKSEPKDFFRNGNPQGWRTELTHSEIALIERIACDGMRQYKYEPVSKGTAFTITKMRYELAKIVEWRANQLVRHLKP